MRRPVSLILAVALASSALAQVAPPGPVGQSVINMRDVEIAIVAEQISRLTGRTLILDPQVRGAVTVTSTEPLGAEGVWQLFLSVLRVHGFAAVRAGRVWRIVPQAEAAREAGVQASGGQVVTRLVRLRNLSPDAAARIFRPIVAQFGSVEPLANPPAIIVTDYADNVSRIESLARALDGGSGTLTETITLRLAAAKDVGTAIRALYGEGEGAPRVAVDERSNVIVVRGDARAVAEARRIAERMDRPGGATPTTRVFRLKNADAESVVEILRGLVGGEAQSANPVARTLAGERSIGAGAVGTAQASGLTGLSVPIGNPLASGSGTTGSTNGAATSLLANGGALSGGASSSSTGFATSDLAAQSAAELNAIVVRGTPAAIAQVGALIDQLDIRRPQVMIEAAVVEITGDKAEALGVQFGLGNGLPGLNGGVSSFSNIGVSIRDVLATLGVPIAAAASASGLTGAISAGDNFQAIVQALGTSSKANLLSTPSITTLDNQPAQIVVGQNVPFRTGSYTTVAGSTTSPFTTVERQDVGLTLRIVPRVHEGDVVRLEVSQEVSSIADAVTGAADIVTNRRAIQTTVLADDRQTIVLGGLITDDRMNSRSQVPVLGDIPVVGNLFKSRQLSQTKRTLFVFLRPTILRSADQIAATAASRYARLRGAETDLAGNRSLLLDPPRARLTPEIEGIY